MSAQAKETKSVSVNALSQPQSAPAMRPTKKQKELLLFIEQFIAQHGYSPSYREIMNGLQYNSVATVAVHVRNLMLRGHLRKRDHSARSLEVVLPLASPVDKPLLTNQITETEEKWLVDKVQKMFQDAESSAFVPHDQLEDIRVVLRALQVLGMTGAAESFSRRLQLLSRGK